MREKSNWFQKERKNEIAGKEAGNAGISWRHKDNRDRGPPTTTLYVPATPGGVLAMRLQEVDLKFADIYQQGWTKVIERGGKKLKDLVTNKYPWAEVSCQRKDCLLCRSSLYQPPEVLPAYRSQVGKCYNRSVCYQITCVACVMMGIRTKYMGETCRSAYERVKEHMDGLKKSMEPLDYSLEDVSPLLKHQWVYHPY